jgi:hypothetical protein
MTVTFRFDRWFTKECENFLAKNDIKSYEFDGSYCVLQTENKDISKVLSAVNYIEFISVN